MEKLINRWTILGETNRAWNNTRTTIVTYTNRKEKEGRTRIWANRMKR